ncbi:MAG: ABC transporter ATP-binding protein [Cyclobacteriaceae bacterium]|jgi:subfamily B ATP-binding cassette protein MsbA
MKTLWRLLSYVRPLNFYLPQFFLYTFLGVLFGLLNLTLLKPLFDIIFNQIDPELLATYSSKPVFTPNFEYIIHAFYYYLIQVTTKFGDYGSLIFICIIIISSNLLANTFRYLSHIITGIIRAKTVMNLRQDFFSKVSHLHIGFFSSERKGDIMSRISNDVQEIENSITQVLEVTFRDPVAIILSFTYLFWRSPSLTFFTLLMIPIAATIITVIAAKLRKTSKATQESLGRIVNQTEEMISGLRIIKAFNAVAFINGQFKKETYKYARTYISLIRKRDLASPLSEFVGVIFVAAILVYGGSLVLKQQSNLDASGFITYIIVFSQVLTPAKSISKAIANIQRGIVSGERLFKIIDIEPAIKNNPNAITKDQFNEKIEFQNVYFSYDENPVLKDINLVIPKGETIALVGPSGGGKSSLVDLIPRFYDIQSGKLMMDNTEIKNIDLISLRSLMGIVTQESILFNDTIFNNIAFGLNNVSEEDVEQAAKVANAHEFIIQTTDGYHTNIGERGSKLSGGQRQRISIARAILNDPAILILDEATSALDSESEKLVQDALDNLMRGRTSIVIAHRLSTIQKADHIIVLKDGEIVEEGNHDKLIKMKGLYKKLSEMQSF